MAKTDYEVLTILQRVAEETIEARNEPLGDEQGRILADETVLSLVRGAAGARNGFDEKGLARALKNEFNLRMATARELASIYHYKYRGGEVA